MTSTPPRLRDRVAKVVEKHMPTSKRRTPQAWTDYERFSEYWASAILHAGLLARDRFQVSADVETFEKLERALNEVSRLSAELTYSGARAFSEECQMLWEGYPEDALRVGLANVEALRRAVTELRRSPTHRTAASRKLNWDAVSVAKECRSVWAQEEFDANPEKYGTVILNALNPDGWTEENRAARERFMLHLRDHAPKNEKNNRPGPFGRFVEDVYETLGIYGRDGEAVRAASALAALKRLESQQKNHKN